VSKTHIVQRGQISLREIFSHREREREERREEKNKGKKKHTTSKRFAFAFIFFTSNTHQKVIKSDAPQRVVCVHYRVIRTTRTQPRGGRSEKPGKEKILIRDFISLSLSRGKKLNKKHVLRGIVDREC